jgi:hypothetical protein
LGHITEKASVSTVAFAPLHRGEVEVIEHGRWGPDNVILRWTYPERTPWYLLAELRDAAPADPS